MRTVAINKYINFGLSKLAIGVSLGVLSLNCGMDAIASDGIELIATKRVSGELLDKSELTGVLETGNPRANFGGLSAIDYIPEEDAYVVLSDRGPADGESSFPCRFHIIKLPLSHGKGDAKTELGFELVRTAMLKAGAKTFTGSLAALRSWDGNGRCPSLDPEGIRSMHGMFVISDEYGPSIEVFSQDGTLKRGARLPECFALSELRKPPFQIGTFSNRGMEGLAVTPSQSVIGAMQGPLVQDGRIVNNKCLGSFTRWLKFQSGGETWQYVYPLTDESMGVSEVLAIDENRFLVIERDSLAGSKAVNKHIYLASTLGASDVSNVASLASGLPDGVKPIRKRLFIDLLAPEFGLCGDQAPEKPEGIAWGPTLADGRKLLIVCYDNDFVMTNETLFLAFAIDPSSLDTE